MRDFSAVDIGQAYRLEYQAGRSGALQSPETDVTVSPLNLRHVLPAAVRAFTTDPGFLPGR
jgi:hypothetical protein